MPRTVGVVFGLSFLFTIKRNNWKMAVVDSLILGKDKQVS